jgi:S1-C subfamily serine protease
VTEPPVSLTPRRLAAALVLAVGIGLLGGASAAWAIYHRLGPAAERVVTVTTDATGASRNSSQGATVDSIARAGVRSVVKVVTQPVAATDLSGDPPGFATGVVASSDGLIVTSTHALRGASRLRIATSDGGAYDGVVAATDVPHGIAILHAVQASGLHPLKFATGTVTPGDVAVVLGSPAFASESVSSGTVNSTGRSVAEAPVGPVTPAPLLDVMTADALPDASADGGPVLDGSGDVIGIVAGGSHQGVPGMVAASGRYAAALVNRATKGAAAVQPSFGVESVWLDPATAGVLGLSPGAFIRTVDPGGPSAGRLQSGDVVTAVNGAAVDATHPFDPATFGYDVGQPVTLALMRAGRSVSAGVTVAAR